jgi:hypothetical protein
MRAPITSEPAFTDAVGLDHQSAMESSISGSGCISTSPN